MTAVFVRWSVRSLVVNNRGTCFFLLLLLYRDVPFFPSGDVIGAKNMLFTLILEVGSFAFCLPVDDGGGGSGNDSARRARFFLILLLWCTVFFYEEVIILLTLYFSSP